MQLEIAAMEKEGWSERSESEKLSVPKSNEEFEEQTFKRYPLPERRQGLREATRFDD